MRAVSLIFLSIAMLLSGCGSIAYRLPGHTAEQHTATVRLDVGQRLLALETPTRLPVPGGFWLGLASEAPQIVAVESVDGARGASKVTLVARARGATTVHYVNRFAVPEGATLSPEDWRERSLGSFTVEVQ